MPVQIQLHRPGLGEIFRVRQSGPILDRIGVDRRETFVDPQRCAAGMVSRLVQPHVGMKVENIRHQRIAVPASDRISVPQIDFTFAKVIVTIEEYETRVVHVLGNDRQEVLGLHDLKGEGDVSQMRDTGPVASRERIGRLAVRQVLRALGQTGGRVGYLPVRRVDYDSRAGGHSKAGAVRFHIEMRRGVEDLPDALEVRLAVPIARCGIRLRAGIQRQRDSEQSRNDCCRNDPRERPVHHL